MTNNNLIIHVYIICMSKEEANINDIDKVDKTQFNKQSNIYGPKLQNSESINFYHFLSKNITKF